MHSVSTGLVLGVAVAWLAVSASPSAQGNPPAAKKNPIATSAASIAAGQKAYQTYCRHCHGAKGLGDGPLAPKDPPPSNLTDAEWTHGSSDGEIFAVISDGAGADSEMKPMRTMLNETQIWNIVNYLRTLGPKTAAP
jgi:mono/diheme cytochrome c family protein